MNARTFMIISFWACFLFAFNFTSAQLLQNGGFESITSVEGELHVKGWTFRTNGAAVTEDAHAGKYAVKMWNWYYYAPGLLTYGIAKDDMDMPGVAIAANPIELRGWYKYVYEEKGGPRDHVDNRALVTLMLSAPSSHSDKLRDTIAYVRHLLPFSDDYVAFSIPISYRKKDVQADSISLRFESSEHGSCSAGEDGNCLYFTVDDLELVAEGNSKIDAPSTQVPNPQKGKKRKTKKGNS
jgi:hypothetical protein